VYQHNLGRRVRRSSPRGRSRAPDLADGPHAGLHPVPAVAPLALASPYPATHPDRPVTRALDMTEFDRSASDVVERDREWMQLALEEARAAEAADEVPVGAVLVLDGVVVARDHNRTRERRDPTAHAEMLVLSRTASALQAQRLLGATLYCTVEPCLMCAGALLHARVERVVWAVRDPKFGGCRSLAELLDHPRANHRVRQAEGVCAEESRALLQAFFRKKRSDAR
jgi:tRNA(adenine34) deaminase